MPNRFVILHNVRSAHNVGAIFRTADAAGVSAVYLCGYTPTPIDRFGRPNEKLAKTALGAATTMTWEHHTETTALVTKLRSEGVYVVAVEQTEQSVSLFKATIPNDRPVAFVLGNEVLGVPTEVCAAVDRVVELPMLGEKESLNVAVTTGIVLYHDLEHRV
ncbi:TrmH family RNA methyltransferase [Patescibacteria group bacterium]|nr:TrmH family RNA methyltransferase [Patescibacteria group bacterium]